MKKEDIREVASLHAASLPGMLSQLGEGFLRKFYKISLGIPEMFTFVAEEDDKVVGIVSGVEKMKGMMTRIFLTDPVGFSILLAKKAAADFGKIAKISRTVFYPGFSYDEAELLTLAVCSDFQNKGIGKRLVKELSEEFKKKGIKTFLVSVYDRLPANGFYKKIGWKFERSFTFGGEKMNYYRYG